MEVPQTRYAITDDGVHIAYQVSGGGPIDLLWSEGWLSHVEILWEYPKYARWMAHSLGWRRQQVEMLGWAVMVNALTMARHGAAEDLETAA